MNGNVEWRSIVMAGRIAVLADTAVSLSTLRANRLTDASGVAERAIAIPANAEGLERGRNLAHTVTCCAGCYTAPLSAKISVEKPTIGVVLAPDLTSGRGGVDAEMPWQGYAGMAADEHSATRRYLQSLPDEPMAGNGTRWRCKG